MQTRVWLVALLCCCVSVSCVAAQWVNEDVSRTINLKKDVALETLTVVAINEAQQPASSYRLALPDDVLRTVALLEVEEKSGRVSSDFHFRKVEGHQEAEVQLESAVEVGSTVSFEVRLYRTGALRPLPAQIRQQEQQLMLYATSAYLYSPYPTRSQKTVFILATSDIERYTEVEPTNSKGSRVKYGPYRDVEALSVAPIEVHFRHDADFITCTSLLREVEVSHWGNVAVEEHWFIRHSGAQLKGSFSRFSYRNPMGQISPSAVHTIRQHLPAEAADLYYRDSIGNVTTSHVRRESERVVFELRPRYPLFGGWKARFHTGYNLPLSSALGTQSSTGKYRLRMRVFDPLDGHPIERFTLKVVLPEGATDFELQSDVAFDSQSTEKRVTYLDTTGRPVIVATLRNVVAAHAKDFVVTYSYSTFAALRKPLVVIAGFFVVLLVGSFLLQLNLSIAPANSQLTQQQRAAGSAALANLLKAVNSLNEQSLQLEDGIQRNERKRVEQVRRSVTESAKVASGRAAEAVAHFLDMDEELALDVRRLASLLEQRSQALLNYAGSAIKGGGEEALEAAEDEYRRSVSSAKNEIAELLPNVFPDL